VSVQRRRGREPRDHLAGPVTQNTTFGPNPQRPHSTRNTPTTPTRNPLDRCGGSAPAVAQLLLCTAQMVVQLSEGGLSPGLCALTYKPADDARTLRALHMFPCGVFQYTGIGESAESACESSACDGLLLGRGLRFMLASQCSAAPSLIAHLLTPHPALPRHPQQRP